MPGLAIGAPLGRNYQLYYLFPLTTEQQTLALVQRTIVAVGLALVFLLAAIASLVTRWVVIPVRQAARGAQRLSTGNLAERMAGPRRGRPGRAGHLVQRDGRQPGTRRWPSCRSCRWSSGSSCPTCRTNCAPP